MTEFQLKRCKEVLDYFSVKYDSDVIYLSDGGNSCIMNPNTQFKEFLGCSINSIAQAIAEELGKKTEWIKFNE